MRGLIKLLLVFMFIFFLTGCVESEETYIGDSKDYKDETDGEEAIFYATSTDIAPTKTSYDKDRHTLIL